MQTIARVKSCKSCVAFELTGDVRFMERRRLERLAALAWMHTDKKKVVRLHSDKSSSLFKVVREGEPTRLWQFFGTDFTTCAFAAIPVEMGLVTRTVIVNDDRCFDDGSRHEGHLYRY